MIGKKKILKEMNFLVTGMTNLTLLNSLVEVSAAKNDWKIVLTCILYDMSETQVSLMYWGHVHTTKGYTYIRIYKHIASSTN